MKYSKLLFILIFQVLLQAFIGWIYIFKQPHADKNAAILPFFVFLFITVFIQLINGIMNFVALNNPRHQKKIIFSTTVLLIPVFLLLFSFEPPFTVGIFLALVLIVGNISNMLIAKT